MKKLKISFEYGVSPLWVSLDDGFFENYDASDGIFSLSSNLVDKIVSLNQHYQATFNAEYPPESGFSGASKEQFDREVIEMKKEILNECGDKFHLVE